MNNISHISGSQLDIVTMLIRGSVALSPKGKHIDTVKKIIFLMNSDKNTDIEQVIIITNLVQLLLN